MTPWPGETGENVILLPSEHQTAAEEDASSSCADNETFHILYDNSAACGLQVAFSCKERV